jgi:hypothetical protein
MKQLLAFAMLVVLVACTSAQTPDPSAERSYPYFTSMPSPQALKENYQNNVHQLSPITAYHFNMLAPKGWQTLDVYLTEEPAPGDFTEMGVFRQAGNWMNDEKSAQNAEISVSVYNAANDNRSAAKWLEDTLTKNAPGLKILERHIVSTDKEGDAADFLAQYNDASGIIMNRIMAFKKDDKIYVVSGSDTINGYRDIAEAFYTAIGSFQLVADPNANPFRDE